MSHKGSCHCGQIAFEVQGAFDTAMECNCSHAIKHRFCPKCGCAPFGFGTSNGAEIAAINVRCLEGVELSSIKRKFIDGRSF